MILKVATAEQMRQCDATAIGRHGIPGLVLMENAGRGTVEAMASHFGPLLGKRVAVFVGPGNNGGDGLVIARYLFEQGAQPQVVSLVPLEKIQGDAAVNRDRLQLLSIPLQVCQAMDDLSWLARMVAESDLLVDALFGTGLKREVSGLFYEVIRCLNAANAPVVAVDIPSGLDTDSGLPLGICVCARLTCTYGLVKLGQLLPPGKDFVGQLVVVDIGIPDEVVGEVGVELLLLEPPLIKPWLPRRGGAVHKGTFGHVLTVAGSYGKAGAAMLCAMGALRSGAGLVSMAAPQMLNALFQTRLPEAMTLPLPFSKRSFSDADYELIFSAAETKKALAIGPGLGSEEATGRLVERLYGGLSVPMVVDADGLNLLAANPVLLSQAAGPRVLTPHPGEMARLAGISAGMVQRDRPGIAAAFAREHGIYLVLKGAATVVAAPDGRLAVNPTGNSGMAAGGMGDVLTGLLAGLVAQGVPPWEASCLAVYLHGLAADRLVRAGQPFGFLAGEVAAELPAAFAELLAAG